jgi:hypothetical protein
MHIGVTGPRRLTPSQKMEAIEDLMQLLPPSTTLHAGDAKGLDALARELAGNCRLYRYDAEGWKPWQLQRRSRAMVDALVVVDGTLHAWPNKACPVGLTATSWKGSGTWGTVRYAISKGIAVELHPLTSEAIAPDWLEVRTQQLVLW